MSHEAVFRRTTLSLLLPIAGITLLNGIDRMNVSFAGQQLSQSLSLTPGQFGQVGSAFFVAYLLFQYPHVLLLKRLGIRIWLFAAILAWGIAGVLMSRAESFGTVVAARLLLGAAEAGFAPGMTWYISQWTPRTLRARAMAVTLGAVPASMMLGGPLCGALLGMENPLGIEPWRWMFFVSALPNFLAALFAAAWFVDRPSQARWLDRTEGLALESHIAADVMDRAGERITFGAALRDGRILLCAAVWLLTMTGAYALVFWLPQIIRNMSLADSEWLIGSLSALPQVGLMAGLYLNARHSDLRGERLGHTAAGAAMAGIGLAASLMAPDGVTALALLVVTGFGLGAAQGVFWALPPALGIGGGQVPVGVVAAISMAGT
ncbi:MAG: hypothetical protein RLZZ200_593, partial [Pseudomonadota bacterium]